VNSIRQAEEKKRRFEEQKEYEMREKLIIELQREEEVKRKMIEKQEIDEFRILEMKFRQDLQDKFIGERVQKKQMQIEERQYRERMKWDLKMDEVKRA
jgi:hypothetical protein